MCEGDLVMELDRDGRELSAAYELTLEELEAVSGGCGPKCCPKDCNCGNGS